MFPGLALAKPRAPRLTATVPCMQYTALLKNALPGGRGAAHGGGHDALGGSWHCPSMAGNLCGRSLRCVCPCVDQQHHRNHVWAQPHKKPSTAECRKTSSLLTAQIASRLSGQP